MTPYLIGFDLGGTKTECIVMDEQGAILFRERQPTPSDDYAAILAVISESRDKACAATGSADHMIGIAIPGAIDPRSTLVKNANTTALIGRPFREDIARKLGQPVAVANDANCLALSEATDGAGAGYETVFAAILGTGAGGGIAVGGQIITGRNRVAGEWGHNSLPFFDAEPQNRPCYCGKTDCIETYVSGPGLSQSYSRIAGTSRDAQDIWALAEQGDDAAARAVDQYLDDLAKALSTVVNILDPDAIVLGGGMSNADPIYEHVPALLERYVFNAAREAQPFETPILKSKWGDSSGVRGAAWLPTLRQ